MTSTHADNDAALSLAFAVHSNPSAYALLLGAGVSAPSVHTAWHVLEDLCRKVALLQAADPGDDAIWWYEQHFNTEPQYGTLLEKLARTRTERQRLLAGYFEPTAEDVEAGRKVPTKAHEAIAQLVLAGSVRVIVTLNFDRLMEQALRAAGVEPTVAATPADIEGLAPLHTLKCVVIHLNGDYLNPTSMLNTESELDGYDDSTQALLERILADYGLIVAGWSAKYDTHLRNTISRVYPSRYTLTWIDPFEPNGIARELGTRTNAIYLTTDADTAFGTLRDAVESLATRNAAHPLTVPVAVETAKRELSGRSVAIGLHDRIRTALDQFHNRENFRLDGYDGTPDRDTLVDRSVEAIRLPAALIATLAYWGDDTSDGWWVDELARFTVPATSDPMNVVNDIKELPGTWLLYAAAVAAVTKGRWSLVQRLLALNTRTVVGTSQVALSARLDPTSALGRSNNRPGDFYPQVSELLTSALSVAAPTIDDAWQVFEILKTATAKLRSPLFAQHYARYQALDTELEKIRAAGEPHHVVNAAWENAHRAFGSLVYLDTVDRVHVLVHETDLGRMESPAGMQLRDAVRATGQEHPLVASGVLPDAGAGAAAVGAAAIQFGVLGRDLIRARPRSQNRTGYEAPVTAVWLDTGLAPGENGPATL